MVEARRVDVQPSGDPVSVNPALQQASEFYDSFPVDQGGDFSDIGFGKLLDLPDGSYITVDRKMNQSGEVASFDAGVVQNGNETFFEIDPHGLKHVYTQMDLVVGNLQAKTPLSIDRTHFDPYPEAQQAFQESAPTFIDWLKGMVNGQRFLTPPITYLRGIFPIASQA